MVAFYWDLGSLGQQSAINGLLNAFVVPNAAAVRRSSPRKMRAILLLSLAWCAAWLAYIAPIAPIIAPNVALAPAPGHPVPAAALAACSATSATASIARTPTLPTARPLHPPLCLHNLPLVTAMHSPPLPRPCPPGPLPPCTTSPSTVMYTPPPLQPAPAKHPSKRSWPCGRPGSHGRP